MQLIGSVCPQTWRHIAGFLKSTPRQSVQLKRAFRSGFAVFPWQWLCETAAISHKTGACLTAGRRPDSASQRCAFLNVTLLSSPQTAPLIPIFFYLFFITLPFTWAQTKRPAASPSPSTFWEEVSNRTWEMQPFTFSPPFWFLHRDLLLLIHF